MKYKNIDLHMHSNFSDGTDSPSKLVELASHKLDLFSLTDHDTLKGAREIIGIKNRPLFLTGIEFSCKDMDGRKSHILGYGFNIDDAGIAELTKFTYEARVNKVINTLALLRSDFGISLPENVNNELINANSPSHALIANALVKHGFASSVDDAFRKYINNYRGRSSYITPQKAIEVTLNAGGIPVLAHGIFEDGGGNLSFAEIYERVKRFKQMGLMGLECYYSSFTKANNETMLEIAKSENLLVTAGSDYHGAIKTVEFGDIGSFTPSFEIMEPFYEVIENRVL